MSQTFTHGGQSITLDADLSLTMFYLRETLADCATFRAVVAQPLADWNTVVLPLVNSGLGDRTNALNAVYFDRFEAMSSTAARAFIRPLNEQDLTCMGVQSWDLSRLVVCRLEFPIPTLLRGQNMVPIAAMDFWEKAGRISREIMLQAGTPLRSNTTSIAQGPMGQANPDDENGVQVRLVDFLLRLQGGD